MTDASELSLLFERVPVALYRSDAAGNLMMANNALAELLGFEDPAEMLELGSVQEVYVDPAERERWLEEVERRSVVLDFDVEMRRQDGTTIWVQDAARAIKDDSGATAYYEGALIDVTEKVRAQKSRDEFLAAVSHELRNPIAAVLGLGQELADRYDSFGDDERREMAAMIARQAEDASWLIEDLLVAHRDEIEKVTIAPEDFDLIEGIERTLEVFGGGIELDLPEAGLTVKADPRRTRQIIRNLASNAVHYGGDRIVVTVERGDGQVEVRVCDDGDEIPPDEVRTIFQAFKRGSRTAHPTSVGLGLPVARQLARLMGGDLEYRYEGGYSCFVLTLPVA